MKNVDQLYEKYYSAYKNDCDNDDGFGYKQFELFDKTNKKPKLDGETKNFLMRLKIEKRVLIKRDL